MALKEMSDPKHTYGKQFIFNDVKSSPEDLENTIQDGAREHMIILISPRDNYTGHIGNGEDGLNYTVKRVQGQLREY